MAGEFWKERGYEVYRTIMTIIETLKNKEMIENNKKVIYGHTG